MSNLIEQVLHDNPTPPIVTKRPHGYWNEPVKAVKALTDSGFPIAEAIRRVLIKLELNVPKHFQGLRASYYNHYKRTRNSP